MNAPTSPQNSAKQAPWTLDPRLAADTLPILTLSGCDIVLMNDRRWPWLIVVPRILGAQELHDLDSVARDKVLQLSIRLGDILKQTVQAEKLNTAAIGNIVRQLHIHVIARTEGDANWPAPVWGYGVAEKYKPEEVAEFARQIRAQLTN